MRPARLSGVAVAFLDIDLPLRGLARQSAGSAKNPGMARVLDNADATGPLLPVDGVFNRLAGIFHRVCGVFTGMGFSRVKKRAGRRA